MAALAQLKKAFIIGDDGKKTQLRTYPAELNCAHNVGGGKCFVQANVQNI